MKIAQYNFMVYYKIIIIYIENILSYFSYFMYLNTNFDFKRKF